MAARTRSVQKIAFTIILLISFVFITSNTAFSAKRTQKTSSAKQVSVTAKKNQGSTRNTRVTSKRSTNKAVHRKGNATARRSLTNVAKKKHGHTYRAMRQSEPPVAAAENDGEFIEYRVKKGDTLDTIAKEFNVEKEDILASNNIDAKSLPAVLLIPKAGEEEDKEAPVITLSPKSFKPWRSNEEKYMLVKAAKSFMGAPYLYGGESVRGLDCSAFVRKIYDIFDVQLPRTAKEQFRVGSQVSKDNLAVGDLVFFRTKRGVDYPTHVGIYIGNGNFIHSSSGRSKLGVAIDALSSSFYSRTYMGATRIKKSPDEGVEQGSRQADRPSNNS